MDSDYPIIPGYELRGVLGTGGFATVYLARHVLLDRLVALKVMDPMLARDREFCERFVREARDTAKLGDHANIVTIHDIGRVGDVYYIAMQYLPGPNLKTLLDEGRPCGRPLDIIARVACALSHAHAQGFVHRDIKPANILFDEANEAVLSDFGIAKTLGRDTQLTAVGSIVGTARYMSPEQATAPDAIDHRSDLYSLGVVLYEMIAGAAPYGASDPMALMLAHVRDPVPTLPSAVASCQPLIDRLMAKRPEDRHASAEALLEDLAHYSLDVPACPPDPSEEAEGDAEAGRRPTGARRGAHASAGASSARVAHAPPAVSMSSLDRKPLFAGAAALAAVLVGGYVLTDPRVLAFVSPAAEPTALDGAAAERLADDEAPVALELIDDGATRSFVSNASPPDEVRREPAILGTDARTEADADPAATGVGSTERDSIEPDSRERDSARADIDDAGYRSLSDVELQRLQRLLDVAELHELVGRISTPPGANAIEAYSLALSLDPGNAVARDALVRLQDD